jgi:hypothetical protein
MAEVHLPHARHDLEDNPEVHYETSDVNIRGILMFGAALMVTVIVVGGLMWVLFRYLSQREAAVAPVYPLAVSQAPRLPPEPRLQTNPRGDLAELQGSEEEALKAYGWVDKNAGVVRIPIEEAMKIVIQKGLPARQAQP